MFRAWCWLCLQELWPLTGDAEASPMTAVTATGVLTASISSPVRTAEPRTSYRVPLATYRLQFNPELRFNHARSLIPYLSELGVTDIYASPLLQARRGSPHGYDVTDPSHLNVELGTGEEFDALVHDLRERDMGLLLDIVPNHMAASSENPWWMDVLEEGPKSPFSPHFDIDWHPPNRSLENRVLLPVLGKPYAQVLENR